MVPKQRNVRTANYAGHLVKAMGVKVHEHSRELVAEAEIVRDVSRMARDNDLAYVILQAERDHEVLATWLGVVNEKHYHLYDPYPPASPDRLRDCDFRLHVYRMGNAERYAQDLGLHWVPGWVDPDRPYTGSVDVVPRGPRRGRIRSPMLDRDCDLLRRDAIGLSSGDEVRFAVAQHPRTGQLVAFLVTKADDGNASRPCCRPEPRVAADIQHAVAEVSR